MPGYIVSEEIDYLLAVNKFYVLVIILIYNFLDNNNTMVNSV